MWSKTHKKFYPGISANDIWRVLTDINNWPQWHDNLDLCSMTDDFSVGNHFTLKPKGGPRVKNTLMKITKEKSFTDCTPFFGAKMFDKHQIEIKDNGVLLTNQVTVTGPLKWLWIKLVAGNVAKTMPAQMDSLVRYTESTATA